MHSFYQRQSILTEVGLDGQKRLSKTKILVIGAGGLGCPVLEYITAAGVGEIDICDYDTVDYTNLHRQVLFTPEDCGKLKSEIAKKRLNKQNPNIIINSLAKRFDLDFNLSSYDLVIDCSDNFETKFIAHDLCFINNIPLIQGSIHKFEGQIQFFQYGAENKNQDNEPCLRCLWPKEPEKSCVQTCSEAGVLGFVPGVIGTLQASEAIKYILKLPTLNSGQTQIINLFDFSTQKIKWKKEKFCPLCTKEKNKIDLRKFNYGQSDLEIEFKETTQKKYLIVSLVDPQKEKTKIDLISNSDQLLQDLKNTPKDNPIALICQRGIMSLKATQVLRNHGFKNSYSLKGGFEGL